MSRSSLFPTPVNSRVTASGSLDRRGSSIQRLVRGERVVISRRHCHFESITPPTPRRDMRALQAAKLAARARSPFKSPSVKLVWSDGRIGIWSWPSELLAGLGDSEFEAVPESLLDAPHEGEVLRRRDGGFEGQVWRNRNLVASRWWDLEPDERQWSRFVRAVPAATEAAASAITESDAGLARLAEKAGSIATSLKPRDLAALAIVLLALPLLFLSGQWLRATQDAGALQRELATLAESTSDVVAARAGALEAGARLRTYSDLLGTPHPAAAIAVFAEAAAGFDATLESFSVREGSIEIELAGNSDIPLARLVAQLENSEVLEGVRLETGNRANRWRIFASFESGSGA